MITPGNAQAQGSRSEQQDAFAFSDLADEAFCAHAGALCVLCDGMGGHAAGGDAARAAVAQFLACYCRRDPAEPIAGSLEQALFAANDAVLDVAAQAGDSGSTLVAAVLHDGLLRWISVGDSRLMLLRDGRLYRVNREHRHRSDLLRSAAHGDVDWEQARNDPRGELLVSSLGEPVLEAIDRSLRPLPLQPGDQVYLASDGLYRTVADDVLLQAARPAEPGHALSPDAVCAAWVELALAAELPSQDNVTVAGLAWQPSDDRTAAAMAAPCEPAQLPSDTAAPVAITPALQPTASEVPASADSAASPTHQPRRRSATVVALVALGAAGMGATWLGLRNSDGGTPATQALPQTSASAESSSGPPATKPDARPHPKAVHADKPVASAKAARHAASGAKQ